MKNFLKLLSQKSLKVVVPSLVALIVGVCGIYGISVNEAELSNHLMVILGLIGTVVGIIANPDKNNEDGEE